MLGTAGLRLAQADGALPATLAAGSAPGESGLSVLSVRFRDGAHFNVETRKHLVCFVSQVSIDCRMAGRALRHEAPAGSLAICPAGIDARADAEKSVDAILVTIDPSKFALAAADDAALEAQLVERLSGYDKALLQLAQTLASESARGYPNGPLFWNEIASGFIDGLVVRHTSEHELPARGALGKDVLARLKEYVIDHIDEPIEVSTLAKIAGRSQYHFTRIFTRSVGISPHRYIVHLRLQRAIELVRDGRSGLAEIAIRTGFADQSHLTRWVRRVHGVSLTQLVG
ncbi:helix-turn-helix domain-containing protein [Bradyrhizobium sp. URHD0069]|uniref:helix-turn-helix domain-containing protein n=1 Tax=Bradyrhizobium sp. URHD0069 TaxID=1380355 RepID=UPI0009E05764|nr:AraC family transcriptional regulator [Bradyrhizobium sp. URHD0069]